MMTFYYFFFPYPHEMVFCINSVFLPLSTFFKLKRFIISDFFLSLQKLSDILPRKWDAGDAEEFDNHQLIWQERKRRFLFSKM